VRLHGFSEREIKQARDSAMSELEAIYMEKDQVTSYADSSPYPCPCLPPPLLSLSLPPSLPLSLSLSVSLSLPPLSLSLSLSLSVSVCVCVCVCVCVHVVCVGRRGGGPSALMHVRRISTCRHLVHH
jgi:hypothetical protein